MGVETLLWMDESQIKSFWLKYMNHGENIVKSHVKNTDQLSIVAHFHENLFVKAESDQI